MFKSLKTSGKKILAGSMVLAALTSGMFASPVSSSTAGLFKSDSDNIQSVTEWSVVEFDKWMVSGNFNAGYLDIVGAVKLGDLTIVPSYNGYILQDSSKAETTSTKHYLLSDSDVVTGSTEETTSKISNGNYYSSQSNTPAVLFGFGNFAGKLSFETSSNNQNGTYNPENDSIATSTSNDLFSVTYENGYKKNESFYPVLSFGAVFDIGDYILKPYVKFGTEINVDSVYEAVSKSDGTLNESSTKKENQNIELLLNPSVGTSFIIPAEKMTHEITFDYSGSFGVYSTNYTDAFGNAGEVSSASVTKATAKTVDVIANSVTTETIVSGTLYEKSYAYNKIGLGYKVSGDFSDQLSVSAKIGLSGNVTSRNTKSYWMYTANANTTDAMNQTTNTQQSSKSASKNTKTLGIDITPTAALGLQYTVKPSKFIVNGGVNVTLPRFYYSSSEVTNPDYAVSYRKQIDENGNSVEQKNVTYQDSNASKTVETSWNKVSASAYTGFSWMMTDKFVVDTSLQLGGTGSGSSIFAYSLGMGCTLKF